MLVDPLGNSRVRTDPSNEGEYHEAFLRLTPAQIKSAKEGLLDPTERDIVKSWEAKKAQRS